MPVDQNRHGGGEPPARGLGDFGVWRCPSCGVEQTTPFDQGCPGCGAGKPGVHVGAPTVPTQQTWNTDGVTITAHQTVWTKSQQLGFIAWTKQQHIEATAQVWALLEAAFVAGIVHEQRETNGMLRTPLPPTQPLSYTAAGAAARTIAAALSHFRDTLYQGADEEVASHEWVDRAELDRLISQYTHAGRELAEGVAR